MVLKRAWLDYHPGYRAGCKASFCGASEGKISLACTLRLNLLGSMTCMINFTMIYGQQVTWNHVFSEREEAEANVKVMVVPSCPVRIKGLVRSYSLP